MQKVTVLKNPLAQQALSHLRDRTTSTTDFRSNAEILSSQLLMEAASNLPLTQKNIKTPLTTTTGNYLEENIVIVTILRAGLAMLGPALKIFPYAPVGLVGLARDEKTALAAEYYIKLPNINDKSIIFLLDPMLATGGSLLHVLEKIIGAKEIRLVTIISAPEGIEAINKSFPIVKIFTAAVDEKLNDKKFIVPGLGDFGDRYFGTE